MVGKKENRESGQTTLEFALTLILLMAFILFYFQLTMIFAIGNYVHYATFMSARAYLSAGPSQTDQRQRARDVIVAMLKRSPGEAGVDRFPAIAKGEGGDGDVGGLSIGNGDQFVAGDRSSSWMQGVRYTFKSRLFILPLSGRGTAVNSVTLTSESWLGREPDYDECQADLGDPSKMGYFDNGC